MLQTSKVKQKLKNGEIVIRAFLRSSDPHVGGDHGSGRGGPDRHRQRALSFQPPADGDHHTGGGDLWGRVHGPGAQHRACPHRPDHGHGCHRRGGPPHREPGRGPGRGERSEIRPCGPPGLLSHHPGGQLWHGHERRRIYPPGQRTDLHHF